MGIYLGIIDIVSAITNKYVNFKPIYEYKNNNLSYMTMGNRQELLPESELLNINFYSSDQNIVVYERFHQGEFLLLDFETKNLEANYKSYNDERNRTGYKIDVATIPSERLRKLSEIGLYRFIDSVSFSGNYRNNPIIEIESQCVNLYDGLEAVLELKDNLVVGPYSISWRERDARYIVNTSYKNNKYIISGLSFKDNINQNLVKIGNFDNECNFIWCLPEKCSSVPIDVVTPELLLQDFRDSLSADFIADGKLDLSDVDKLVNHYKNSALVGADLPQAVQKQRIEKLHTLLTDESNLQDTFDYISNTIAAILLKYKDTKQFTDVLDTIASDSGFMSKIQSFKIINDKIANGETRIDELSQTLAILQDKIEGLKSQDFAVDLLEGYEKEIDTKKREKVSVESEIAVLKNQLHIYQDGVNLQELLDRLNDNVDYKEKRERELDAKIRTIEDRLDEKFANSTEKAINFAFDGMLSSRMLKQASDWENGQQAREYDNIITQLQLLKPESLSQVELIDYICSQVRRYRPDYDRNTILNIIICITQGFLTVFSGEPGTGKTSICNIIANTLGLTLPKTIMHVGLDGFDPNRYVPVSVERGWTTKRDFIGYYNPLTKAFDKSNRRIFDGFSILDSEAKGKSTDLPYVIMLDEANLSPMEYYWADFMNICDDRCENSAINLGENFYFQIPNSLRFVATINNDHTTEALSPRLIDRAWVVRLPIAKNGMSRTTRLSKEGVKLISWNSLAAAFGTSDEIMVPMIGEAKDIYDTIVSKVRAARIPVSSRMDASMRQYWSVAQAVFENETEYAADASIVALDYAVAQKILPQINGGDDQYKECLKTLQSLCQKNNLRISADCLSRIISIGEKMNYYQFFA